MPLAQLNLLANEELAPDVPYDADDQPAADPVTYLSSPGAVVYIYYDEARLNRPGAVDRIVEGYQQRHPDTDFQPMAITLEGLRSRRYFAFPRTEQEFLQRGYAAEFDVRKGPVGRGTSTYLDAQKSVLHVHAQVMAHALATIGPAFFRWNDEFTEIGADESERPAFMQRRVSGNMAPLTGTESVLDGLAGTQFAMVDWEGLRIGRDELRRDDCAHLAFNGSPDSWLKNARDAIGRGYFGWHEAHRVAQQIRLELSTDGLAAYFGPRFWQNQNAQVSAGAVLVWQSQVVASLRKLLWRAEADEGQPYLKNELMKERRALHAQDIRRNPVGSGRLRVGDPEEAFRDVFTDQIAEFVDSFTHVADEIRADERRLNLVRMPDDNVSITVSDRDIIFGALYGSGIDLRDFWERPDPLLELSWWVSDLRRTGEAMIGGSFADLFEEARLDPRTDLSDLVYAALSDGAWRCVVNAAEDIARTDSTILVSYNWSNLEEPWRAERVNDEVHLRGPLLYFPVTEASTWNARAARIWRNGDFVAP